jgi:hypothetical protein
LFEVYLYGELIATVPGGKGETVNEIKWTLVVHDGYPFDIVVIKTRRRGGKR